MFQGFYSKKAHKILIVLFKSNNFFRENATKIEHIFRGYLSHRKLDRLKKQAHQQELNIFYNYMSVIIQKSYRGYYSRKYQHDFYARKKYINDVIDKGNLIKEKMVLYLEDQIKVKNINNSRKHIIRRLKIKKSS